MRHHDRNKKLHREKRQRKALLRSLARSLITHEKIITTEAKAKALRPFIERLITYGKRGGPTERRAINAAFGETTKVARKLCGEIAPRYSNRAGGYTRITRLGRIGKRVGEAVQIEFVK